jgi:hypothetical protein
VRPKGVADGQQANIPALPLIDAMGGQGLKGLPTAGHVGSSPRVCHREIRGNNPGGDDEAIALK